MHITLSLTLVFFVQYAFGQNEYFVYRNKDGSIAFKVTYPGDWTASFDSLPGINLRLEPAIDGDKIPNVQFHFQRETSNKESSERMDFLKSHYAVRAKHFEVISERELKVDEISAYEMIYDLSFSENETVRILERSVIVDGEQHWMTYGATIKLFPRFLEKAKVIMNSYRFN